MRKLFCILVLVFAASVAFSQSVAESSGEAKTPNTRVYDFIFRNVDFVSGFRSISATAGVDILLAPDVKGTMTIEVTQKTWQETLDIVCAMYNLTWLVEDKYISIQNTSTYQAKLKKEADLAAQAEQAAPLVRKNFPISHANASDLKEVLETMKTSRGKVTVVDRTNSIIVYDTEASIEQMANALEELDVETLQIMISAKLVAVNSQLSRELGVDWSANVGSTGSSGSGSRISGTITSYPNNGSSPAVDGASTAITASILDNNMQVAITNLMGDASTEILASPQVSTLDNVEAQVYMGDEISIRVIDDDGESSTEMVETGIKLTVTPHVSGDNRILLDLHPENSSYDYDTKGEVVISTQEAKTKVVVADGETVVIGGLTRSETQESESGVPFLKDIPVLGNLFKYTRNELIKRDLVIFVTPRIIRSYIGPVETSEPTVEKVGKTEAKASTQPAEAEEEEVEYEEVIEEVEEVEAPEV